MKNITDQKILDVWAVQKNERKMWDALLNIKANDTIIYKNVACHFSVGEQKVDIVFDAVIYSEKSDCIILIMSANKEQLTKAENLLDRKQLLYNVVEFKNLDNPTIPNYNYKEFWFARQQNVFNKAIIDSLKKSNSSCNYYPFVYSSLTFYYPTEDNEHNELFNLTFRGLISFDDKVILPTVSQKQHHNLTYKDVLIMLNKRRVNCNVLKQQYVDVDKDLMLGNATTLQS